MTKEQERLENKAKAQALLIEGKPISEVVRLTGIAKSAVARYGQEIRKAQEAQAVEAVSNLDPHTVLALAERLEGTSPALSRNLVHLSKGIDGLNKFEPFMLNAISDVVVTAQERMKDKDIKVGELKTLGELIYKGYATLYNRPSVEINMTQQNNQVVQTAVTERLNSLTKGIFEPIEGEIE